MTTTPIAGGAEVVRQMEVLADELPQPTWGRASQSGFRLFLRCSRAKTNSWALAASTSRTVS